MPNHVLASAFASGVCTNSKRRAATPPLGYGDVAGNGAHCPGRADRGSPGGWRFRSQIEGPLAVVGRRACPRNQSSPRPSPAMASTGSQLKDVSLCTAWAITGDAVAAAATVVAAAAARIKSPQAGGQGVSDRTRSRACRNPPRPLMVMPAVTHLLSDETHHHRRRHGEQRADSPRR